MLLLFPPDCFVVCHCIHLCSFCSLPSLRGNLLVFAQKRTDRGRACWLQLYSFRLSSVVCVQYAVHMCTFTCSDIPYLPARPDEGQVEGHNQGNEKFLTSWSSCTLQVCSTRWIRPRGTGEGQKPVMITQGLRIMRRGMREVKDSSHCLI